MRADKSHKSSFCKGPEAFNPINVGMLVRKFVVALFNTKMLLVYSAASRFPCRMQASFHIFFKANFDGIVCCHGSL